MSMARRHVADGEAHVRRQHEIIARLRAGEFPTDAAEALLVQFEQSLTDHRSHLLRFEEEQRAGLRDEAGTLTTPGLGGHLSEAADD
ncbi:hypothetical protein [Phenylobacterium sp.]|uniref:hypothetical protein n=1 Tax=Phenylobacterium sp. TaxID=1871053 RepID=UPI003941B6DD